MALEEEDSEMTDSILDTDFTDYSDLEDGGQVDCEIVMTRIQKLYTTRTVGLHDTACQVRMPLVTPRQKLTVLLVGHHILAKKEFLDLYFDEARSGGLVEKFDLDTLSRFYIASQSNQRRRLTGEIVFDHCPHLEQLRQVPGLKDYFTTEVVATKKKSFVSFILAPEKVSSEKVDDNNNPLEKGTHSASLDTAMKTLVEASDLVFVFFDPTGKIPPSETLAPLWSLWEYYYPKVHFILAKASNHECTPETREKAVVQLIQTVWNHPVVSKTGFTPQIYCPDLTTKQRDDKELWNVITSSAKRCVETSLRQLKEDVDKLSTELRRLSEQNNKAKLKSMTESNGHIWCVVFLITFVGLIIEYASSENHETFSDAISSFKWTEIVCMGLFLLLLLSVACQCRKIFGRFEPALSVSEENLLRRRLQFAIYAHFEHEKLRNAFADYR